MSIPKKTINCYMASVSGGAKIARFNYASLDLDLFGTVGNILSVVSTNAGDTLAGLGAQKVTIEYYTPSLQLKRTTVEMNGTLAVASGISDCLLVNRIVPIQTGLNGAALGNVRVISGGGSNIHHELPGGFAFNDSCNATSVSLDPKRDRVITSWNMTVQSRTTAAQTVEGLVVLRQPNPSNTSNFVVSDLSFSFSDSTSDNNSHPTTLICNSPVFIPKGALMLGLVTASGTATVRTTYQIATL